MMRLLMTVPWGERLGGAENMLWTFLQHVDRSRVEPEVVFLEPGAFEREVAGRGIATHVLPAGRLRQAGQTGQVVRSLAALLRRQQPHLVLNWTAKTQLYGATAAMAAGMSNRVVWWQHGIPDGHWLDRLATLLPATMVGCSSRYSAEAQKRQWPRRRTFVVWPGIDCPALLSGEMRAALRQRLGIPADRLVAGIVGRLQPWKGQHQFIRALAVLRRRGHDIHGLIVGGDAYHLSPRYEPALQEMVRSLHLSDAVTFTGHVPEAGPYFQVMDIAVNASRSEPFGIVLIEAMALGVPVVAFDSAGPAEIIEPERSGLLVPGDDYNTLAGAIERLVVDSELRRGLAEQGRQRFLSCFTSQRMVDTLERRMEDLTGGKAGARSARY
jgi:glycosyltransferase involved in cell wall biosynthesis